MKILESTRIRILLCSIIVSSITAEHASTHRNGLPRHAATSSPKKKSQTSTVPIGIQMPEKVMATQEVSCISADSNIFDIMNEAKKTCKGNDMKCTFYLFSNLKYYNIGSLDINKELFDKLLMKYDSWLLTAEKIAAKDTVIYSKRDEKYSGRVKEDDTFPKNDSPLFTEVNNMDIDRYDSDNNNDAISHDFYKEHTSDIKKHSRNHVDKENPVRHINVKEKNEKYIELDPKYDKEYKYFEVFLPENHDRGKPRTIHVNINNENDKPNTNEQEIDTKPNGLMANKLEEVPMVNYYDAAYENQRKSDKFDLLSTDIRKYDGKYLNENSYHDQRDLESKDTTASLKPTEIGDPLITNNISTDFYLEQPEVEINDYIDKINTNIQNDSTLIVNTSTDKICTTRDQERLTIGVNIDDGRQVYFNNSDFVITNNTTLNKVSSQDNSSIELTANNRDLNYATDNAIEETLKRSQNNDNVRALNENTGTLVLSHPSETNILSPDIKQDINEYMISNTEHIDGPENAHEKHNLTPLQNETKHMHDLVDQATLNDDFHTHPLEYTNIYNEVDFDDTHLTVHDNNTLRSSNIHLNEPVFLAVDSFKENNSETSPYVIAVPKFEPSYNTISDYMGTQIELTPTKNVLDVSDISASTASVTSMPTNHITSIPEKVIPKTIVPDINSHSVPNVAFPSSTVPENIVSSSDSLLYSDLDSLHDYDDATLPTLAFAPMETVIRPSIGSEVSPTLGSSIFLDAIPNSLSLAEANSTLHQYESTIYIDKSSNPNNRNILETPLSIEDDISSQIKFHVSPKSNRHIDKSSHFVTTPVSPEADVYFEQKPQSFLSKPTESSILDLDFIPGTSLSEIASAKPIYKQKGQQIPSLTRLENPYILQSHTESEPVISNQFQTPTSKITTSESKSKPTLFETNSYLDEIFSKNAEPISLIPMTSLVPKNQLIESGISNPSISHDQQLLVNKISQPDFSPITNIILSDVNLQNHLSTEELYDLTEGELQVDQVLKPSLGTAPFLKAKEPSNILYSIPSQHKPLINLSSPILLSNDSPLTQSDIIGSDIGLPATLPQSGIPLSKYTNPLPNKHFADISSLMPYYSKIPHSPTSKVKPVFNTQLSQTPPLILDNDSILSALNKFSKSTQANPLLEEDFQSIIKELPSDLTNLLLSESSHIDSQLKLPMTDSIRPSVNKLFKHKAVPALDQYTSIDDTTTSNEELHNLPLTAFTSSELQNILPSTLSTTPQHIKQIKLERPSKLIQDSLPKPLLPLEIITALNKDSSAFPKPMLAEYSELTPALIDSHTHVSTSSSVPIHPIKDFSIATESSTTLQPLNSKKVPLEMEPITLQLDKSTQVSPQTLPVPIFEPTPGFEGVDSPLKQLEITQDNPVSPQFYEEREFLLENLISDTKTDLKSNFKLTQFYEEIEPALENSILANLAQDVTEKSTSFTYKPSFIPTLTKIPSPTLSLAPEDSTISSEIQSMESPVDGLSPLPKIPELSHISEQTMSKTMQSNSNALINLHIGPKPLILNQLEVPISKISSVLSESTLEPLTPQDSLTKSIVPHYATILPSNISPTHINQLSLEPFIQFNISPSASLTLPTLANISPLLDTQKLQSQRPIHLQTPLILPSASLSYTDQLESPTSRFASTTLDVDSALIPSYEPCLEYIPQLNVLGYPSKSIPKLPTPLTYTSPVFMKSKPTVPQNSNLLTPKSFTHSVLSTQLPSPQYNIPLSPLSISEMSQPILYTQSEVKNELPLPLGETTGNIIPIEDAVLQLSNVFTPVSLVETLSHLGKPCQKELQTPFTVPNKNYEFLTAAEAEINDRPYIESSLPLNFNTVPLNPTYQSVNNDLFKNIPLTPFISTSSSSYVPRRPSLSPIWQTPLFAKNLQASEPSLYVNSQVEISNIPSIPSKPIKQLLNTASQNELATEFLTLDSHIPVEDISSTLVMAPSYSSTIEPLQYIPELPKSSLLPNLVFTKYKPTYLNDIRPLLDEDISQLLKNMSIFPLTQTYKESKLAAQEISAHKDEILLPVEPPILTTASGFNEIGIKPKKDCDMSPIKKYIKQILLPSTTQKPRLPFPDLISPIPQYDISELSLPVEPDFSFGEVSTVPSNANPCSPKSELPLPSFSSQTLDVSLLPNTLSQLEYKRPSDINRPIDTKLTQKEMPSQLITEVLETLSQDNSPSFENILNPKLTALPPVLPSPIPCPTISPSIFLNRPSSLNYPQSIPYQLQQPFNLKNIKDNAKFSQPIIPESLSSIVSSKLTPATSYADINFAELKPQIAPKPVISTVVPLQSSPYSTPMLLSQTYVLPTSTINSHTPQDIVPQYTPKSSFYHQNFTPMKSQYQIIPNILETIDSISNPKLALESQQNLQVSSVPCLQSVAKASASSPLGAPEYSTLSPTLLSSIQTKPSYTSSILSTSPLQIRPTPQYITPILPTTPAPPLKSYSTYLQSNYAKPISLAESIPILPIQPVSNEFLSGYAMPSYAPILPSVPLKARPVTITPSQVSVKPMSIANYVPLLLAQPESARLPVDISSIPPTPTTLSPCSPQLVYPKQISLSPYQLSESPPSLQTEHFPPTSFVEAIPWSPSFMSKLSKPLAGTQSFISHQLIPALSSNSQYSIPAAISNPTYTKMAAPVYTAPKLPFTTPQKTVESLLPEYIAPVSFTNTYLPLSSPSTINSYTQPCTSPHAYFEPLSPIDFNSQVKRPLSKSQEAPLNISSYDKKPFVNEIQNIPVTSNMYAMKNFAKYRSKSTPSSISNIQINQNDFGNTVIDETITTPSTESQINLQQSTSNANICTDAIEASEKFNKDSIKGTYLDSLSNILEIDEATESLLNDILTKGAQTPSMSVPSVINIPLSKTIIHKKSDLIPSNILKLDEGNEILLNEDLLQKNYLPYSIRSLPSETKTERILSRPHLTPLHPYIPFVPLGVAPQSLSLQSSSSAIPILSAPTLPLKPSSKSPMIYSQLASDINSLPGVTGSLMKQHLFNVLPLQKQSQPSMLSLPYFLVPTTEYKIREEQLPPKYSEDSTSSNLNPLADIISSQGTPQYTQVPIVSHSYVPTQSNITPFSNVASSSSPESYTPSPYITNYSPRHIKPNYTIPWKQGLLVETTPIPINNFLTEVPITTYSSLQDSNLHESKENIQPVKDINTESSIFSQSNITQAEFSSSSNPLTELENSLTTPDNIKASTIIDTDLQISQSNILFPMGNIPKYSKPIEKIPYYTSSRPWPTFLPSDLKPNTHFSENQFKIPSTTPLSYAQSEEATDLYETIKPHPKFISKPSKDQLNAPISLPLTYVEPEFTEINEMFKPHPKLLVAFDQSDISQSTTDNTLPETQLFSLPQHAIPFSGVPISSSSLIRPLMRPRPEIYYKLPEKVVSPSRLLPLSTVDASLDNLHPNSAERAPTDQLYASSLENNLRNPIYSEEAPGKQPEYVKFGPQSPLLVLGVQSLTDSKPFQPTQGPLLKHLLTTSQNIQIPPNLGEYFEITPTKPSPLISNYESFNPSSQELKPQVTDSPIIEADITLSMPNTLQNLPLTNRYQYSPTMLPCGAQDVLHKSHSSPLISPPMNIYSPATLSKPLSLTSANAEILKSSIPQFISPTLSPLVLNPLESYNTLTSRWKSSLPSSNDSQEQLISPLPNTIKLLPNQYQSYSQYKLLESVPSPVAEEKTMEITNFKEEAAIPITWSPVPTPKPLALSSILDTDISELTEPNHMVSELKSYLPVLTSTLPQSKEVTQIPLGYPDLSVSSISAPSSLPTKAKLIDNTDFTEIYSPVAPISAGLISQGPDFTEIYSPVAPVSGGLISKGPISQSSSQALFSPNILQYLPISNNTEPRPLTKRPYIVSPSFTSKLYTEPRYWLQTPIISKSSQLYETPFKQEIAPQKENLQINPYKLTPSDIVTANIETLKERHNLQDVLKLTLVEEPLELNSVKLINPLGLDTQDKDINPMKITLYPAEFSDIANTKTLLKTPTKPKINPNKYTEAEISKENYIDYQNLGSDKLTIPAISQYLPTNNIYTYSPYISPTKIPKTEKLTTPDISKLTKAIHINPISLNPEITSEYANFYANNHIGNTPKLFSIPSTISMNDNALPINSAYSEISNDFIGNTVENLEFIPTLKAAPLALNEFKTIIPVDTPVPIYNTVNILTPCSKSSPKPTSYSPIGIFQTPIDSTEMPYEPTSFISDNEIKYQGYKTYYPSSKLLQSSTKFAQPLPPPKILNTPPKTIPFQSKLELDNMQQGLKFDEHIPIQDIHEHKQVDKELKSMLINYINSKKDMKNNLFNNNEELTIPLGDLAINNKKVTNDFKTIETNNPSIGLKVWKSNAKIVTAELKLKFKELSVNNFMPVINNLNEFDVEEIRKIVKDYIDEKYGNHIEIREPYTIDNQYVVLKDFDHNAFDYRFNLLWPTEYV